MPGLRSHGGRGRLRPASDPLRPIGSPAIPLRTACRNSPECRRTRAAEGDGLRPRDRAPAAVRAQVVLHAARGRRNARIAQETGRHLGTVRCWRGRFAGQGLPGLKDRQRCGRPPVFTPLRLPRSRRWPAGCPPRAECRCRAAHARNWPMRPPGGASPCSCRRRPCAAGRPTMRSSPGSTAPGSSSPTPTSAPKPSVCWTCTPAPGPTPTSTYQRREDLHPGPAATPPSPRARPARCGCTTPTDAAAPWPTWPLTTSTPRRRSRPL